MLKPLGERVLIQQDEERKIGSIVLPQNVLENKIVISGVVKEVGDTKTLKKGYRVYYRKFVAHELEKDDKKYSIIKEEDILAYEK